MKINGRIIAVAAGVLAGAVALGACGGSSMPTGATPPTKPKIELASVLLATSEAKTARVSMTGLGGASGTSSGIDLNGSGAVDFQSQDTELALNAGVAGESVTLNERIVDGIVYTELPIAMPGSSKRWLKIDPQGVLGSDLQSLSQSQSDPTRFLSYLAGVSNDVTAVGHEEVRGVDTTHYRATVDMSKALGTSKLPPALQDRLRSLAPQLGAAKLPVEVWVDNDGRARKEVVTVRVADLIGGKDAGSKLGGDASLRMELEFYDFGAPVTVVAPPADQVMSLDSFIHG